jgi:alanine racemase
MNMCMIDVSAAPQTLRVGDVVTLIGREGMTAVTLDDWARALGTIHYEVAARLSPLVPRVLSDHL